MREILKTWLKKLEFMTGLKQFREMSLEDAKSLIDCLEEKVKEYHWMTEARLNDIMKKGMEGGYGDFYSINVRTVSQWCSTFYEHSKQKLLIENFPREHEEKVVSEEEKQKWLEIGKENFREKFKESKDGHVAPLSEWGPYFYTNFVRDGILKEENYPVNMEQINAELRIAGRQYEEYAASSKKTEKIWRMFIKDMISKGVDLTQYL